MKQEQERVRNLLLDAITLLCRNGLTYKRELKVQGLLAITLDDQDVFVTQICEIMSRDIADGVVEIGRLGIDPTAALLANDMMLDGITPDSTAVLTTASDDTKRGVIQSVGPYSSISREQLHFNDPRYHIPSTTAIEETTFAQENYALTNPASFIASTRSETGRPIFETLPDQTGTFEQMATMRWRTDVVKKLHGFLEENVIANSTQIISGNATADTATKHLVHQHHDLLKINTLTGFAYQRPTFTNHLLSPPIDTVYVNSRLSETSSMQAGEQYDVRGTDETKLPELQADGSDDDDDNDDEDDQSSHDNAMSPKYRLPMPLVPYHHSPSDASLLDIKPYPLSGSMVNSWQGVHSGSVPPEGLHDHYANYGQVGTDIEVDTSGESPREQFMHSSVNVFGAIKGNLPPTQKCDFYVDRSSRQLINSRLPRRPRESMEKRFTCPFCGLHYYYKKHLKFHLKQKHAHQR